MKCTFHQHHRSAVYWSKLASGPWIPLFCVCQACEIDFLWHNLLLNVSIIFFLFSLSEVFPLLPSCPCPFAFIFFLFLEPFFAHLPNFQIMDLVNQSLNAVDKIFSTRRLGTGKPSCPERTLPGFIHDNRIPTWLINKFVTDLVELAIH